jgi:hypothetical protein
MKLFFPNYLQTHFRTDQQRADHVLSNLTDTTNSFLQQEENRRGTY